MEPFPLQTIGGLETLAILFNALAALFQGSIMKSFTVLATAIGAVSAMIYTIWRNDLKTLTGWFVSYNVLVMVLLSPVARVNITDTLTGEFRTVDHVPFALALTASTFSTLSVGLTQKLEQVLQPLHGINSRGGGAAATTASSGAHASSAQLCYSQTGFIFGAQSMRCLKSVQFTNHDVSENMKEFVGQCVVYPALNGHRYTVEDIQKSTDIWGLVSEAPSKLLGFSWRDVERDPHGRFVRSKVTEIITCAEGVQRFKLLWKDATDHALTGVIQKLGETFGISQGSHQTFSTAMATYFPGALNKLMGDAKSASERMRQQMMISSILSATTQKTLELGGTLSPEATRALIQQRQTYQTLGETVSHSLLSMKNVLEALIYGLFIFVMLMALLPQGWKILLFWLKIVGWIQLWPPLFSILNFLVTEYMASSLTGYTQGGLTLWNTGYATSLSSDMAATAGYVSCMIPIIAWAILDQGGYAFVAMASQLLGVAQGASTQSATEKVTGNYSFGNVSMDGTQVDHSNLFKYDRSASYTGGHQAFQEGISSRIVSPTGETVLRQEMSQLPITIHGTAAHERLYRDLYNEAESLQHSESAAATQSRSAMASDYLQLGQHASHLMSKGEQWSDQETATRMKEASHAYNQAKRIAHEFGLSEELVNQKTAEASAGLSVSIDPKNFGPIHVGGTLGGELDKQESSIARALKAENAIRELGQSEEFRNSLQHGYHHFNSQNTDVTDQNLTEAIQDYSSHYEKAHTHQQNAARAYEASQSLQKEQSVQRSQNLSLDANYTQGFVEQMGVERLDKMTLPEMQQEATQYMTQKLMHAEGQLRERHGIPDLKESYHSQEGAPLFESGGREKAFAPERRIPSIPNAQFYENDFRMPPVVSREPQVSDFERQQHKLFPDRQESSGVSNNPLEQRNQTPETFRDHSFGELKERMVRDGISLERPLFNGDESVQARQLIDMNAYRLIRTEGRLAGLQSYESSQLPETVKEHAQKEMGFLQEGAVNDMYDSFKEGEKKPFMPEQEVTAINERPKPLKNRN